MRIGIDFFGGDNAPEAIIDALKDAISEIESTIVLYGDETTIVRLLTENNIKYLSGVTINFDGANSNYIF